MEITADVISAFREYYPEFADDGTWPGPLLTRHLCEADEETGSRWGKYEGTCSLKKRGMFAYAAHKAVIGKAVTRATENGGIPPGASQVQSKSVGDESISYAVSAPTSEQADQLGDLRSTAYGLEFLRLRKRAGMGALCV